jgi:hypothetical protein
MTMQTLFGEVDEISKSLKIQGKGRQILSKNQQAFNKLTKRVENLEKEIVAESDKLNKLLEIQGKEIAPLQKKIADTRIILAMALDRATQRNKFSKKQTEKIQSAIMQLCDDAFMDIEPNEEQEVLYNKWSQVSYKEEIEQYKNQEKEMFSDIMSNMFGFDVDMSEFDGSPEGFARFQKEMHEKFEAQQKNHQQSQRKTKKQVSKDEAQKADEELKNKSLRSIYIALVKVLHPDSETDIVLKAEKEEIMKKVTVAYDDKDLPTLLKLELEWVHKTSEHLEQLTDDKLKIFISVLKQQVAELEQEKFALYRHPRYQPVTDFARFPEKYALLHIANRKKETKNKLNNLTKIVTYVQQTNEKKQILSFIDQYFQFEDEDDFDFYYR